MKHKTTLRILSLLLALLSLFAVGMQGFASDTEPASAASAETEDDILSPVDSVLEETASVQADSAGAETAGDTESLRQESAEASADSSGSAYLYDPDRIQNLLDHGIPVYDENGVMLDSDPENRFSGPVACTIGEVSGEIVDPTGLDEDTSAADPVSSTVRRVLSAASTLLASSSGSVVKTSGYVSWGNTITISMTNGHTFYASAMARYTAGGSVAYCIQPYKAGASCTATGTKSSEAGSDNFWNTEFSSSQQKAIKQIMAAGYPNDTSLNSGISEKARYAATQLLIWEVCFGKSAGDFYNAIYGVSDMGSAFQQAYWNLYYAYPSVSVTASGTNTKPSYDGQSFETIESSSGYSQSVYDDNHVTQYYTLPSGLSYSSSTGYLTFQTTTKDTSVKTLTCAYQSAVDPTIWTGSYQTVVSGGSRTSSTTTATIRFTYPEESTGKIRILKYKQSSSGSSTAESGAVFYVYNSAGTRVDTITTGSNGYGYSGDLAAGTYTIRQISGTDGYDLMSGSLTVSVAAGATATTTASGAALTIYNKETAKKWRVTLKKYVTGTTTPVQGAVFALYASGASSPSATYTTNSSGSFTTAWFDSTGSTARGYYLLETSVPDGYVLDSTRHYLYTGSDYLDSGYNTLDTLTVYNEQESGRIRIRKYIRDADGSTAAESGAVFYVYSSAGAKVSTITTGSNGSGYSDYLAPGTYTIRQISGSDGYELMSGSLTAEITAGATVTTDTDGNALTIYNDQSTGRVRIRKYTREADGSTAAESGAVFYVYGSAGTRVGTITTGSGGYGYSDYLAPGTYTIRQISGSDGYELMSGSLTVQIAADTTVTTDTGGNALTIYNDRIQDTELTISKTFNGMSGTASVHVAFTDSDGNALSGSYSSTVTGASGTRTQNTVTLDQGSAVFSLSDGDSVTLQGLPEGTRYTVTEDQDGSFTLTGSEGLSGTLVSGEPASAALVNTYNPAVVIRKAGERRVGNCLSLLSGSVLQVLDGSGSVIDQWTADAAEPHTLRCGGSGLLSFDTDYVLHEYAAPEGYQTAEDIPFRLSSAAPEDLTLTMRDLAEPFLIRKVDQDGTPLSGVSFRIFGCGRVLSAEELADAAEDGTEYLGSRWTEAED